MTEFSRADLADIVQLVRAVARTEIMPHFRALAPADVQAKNGPLDLVTIADQAAERHLTQGLRAHFPGIVVVGEEATAADPALPEQIAGAALCAIVDPIDGTSNFIAGLPLFASMIAIAQHGQTVAAIIHDPVGDDTALAIKGHGAWIETSDGRHTKLQVADPAPVADMNGSLSWRFLPEPQRSQLCARLPRVAGAWDYRCAAHQYRMAAAGFCHFVAFNRLLPWDHAAGVLLYQEAGGHVARLDGTPYTPASSQGGLIAAPDKASWTALRDALYGTD